MIKQWLKKHLPKRKAIKKDGHLSWLGSTVNNPQLWSFSEEPIARGVGIGFFMAFIPLPMQMLLAGALSIVCKANIPMAAAATWLTNPLTFIPINILIFKVGQLILNDPSKKFNPHNFVWSLESVEKLGKPFLIGMSVLAIAAGVLGYLLVRVGWALASGRKKRKK